MSFQMKESTEKKEKETEDFKHNDYLQDSS